jgi:hypothetical protein
MRSISKSLPVLALCALAVACSSGAPAATPVRTAAAPPTVLDPASVSPGGEPTAEGLCAAFSSDLAAAALGKPADPPQSGDVVPRPNGVYCHYAATGDANTNVEAQLRNGTRDEFESLAETLGATTAVTGVGETAFGRDGSSMGGEGATIVAWSNGRGVSVILNREGDQAAMTAAVKAIAAAALAAP